MDSHGDERLLSESCYPWSFESAERETAGNECSFLIVRADDDVADSPVVQAKPRWPTLIWFLLKLLGLYNRRPAVVGRRLCLGCCFAASERRSVLRGEGTPWYLYPGSQEESEAEEGHGSSHWTSSTGELTQESVTDGAAERGPRDQAGGSMGIAAPESPCVVCQSEWWDAYGRHRPYTEEEIGIKRWNHYGSALLSVIWLTLLVVLNVLQFVPYFHRYWGKADHTVDFIIFTGFVLFLISVPSLCLVANVMNMLKGCRRRWSYSWSSALSVRYIVKRLQHLSLGERGLPYKAFLAVCALWSLANSLWRFIIYFFIFQYRGSVHVNVSLVVGTVSSAIWAAFCYLVALMRLSFQRQMEMELAFLRQHSGTLDRCRRRLASCMEDFGSLGSLAAMWIMFTVAVSTWAIATQVYFDYAVHDAMPNRTFVTAPEMDLLIWSENIMFLALPLVAVGGLDLNRTWLQFRRRISMLRLLGDREGPERHLRDKFCDAILAYCAEHPPVRNTETMALLVSALGLCLAIEFKERDVLEAIIHHGH